MHGAATGVTTLPIPATERLDKIQWSGDDVVLLAVKSQDTEEALRQLAAAAPVATPVVCVQNGVANEPAALRRFANVYGVCVVPGRPPEAGGRRGRVFAGDGAADRAYPDVVAGRPKRWPPPASTMESMGPPTSWLEERQVAEERRNAVDALRPGGAESAK